VKLTARQRIEGLLGTTGVVEYGADAGPATGSLDARADGVLTVTGPLHGATVAVVAYDFSVLGGSQGPVGHLKVDRVLRLAVRYRWPVVFLLEGGGARVQETALGLGPPISTFSSLARLSGKVPTVGAVLGRVFAGHANLAGCCDFVVATEGSALGLAGPPVVEAAIGQSLSPEEIGPLSVHLDSGAVDLGVDDDSSALEAVRKYLGYFLARGPGTLPATGEAISTIVPSDPRQSYDVRQVIGAIADAGSTMELQARFAPNLVTALGRFNGQAVGIIANQPSKMAGALDAFAAEKFSRFAAMSNALGVPLLFLVDTPGFLVGPGAEASGLVRMSGDALRTIANCSVPLITIVLRKAYGFAKSVMGSGALEPLAYLAWPTAEFGAMGMSGAARILEREDASPSPGPDLIRRQERLAQELRANDTLELRARRFNIDGVITPEETRDTIIRLLQMNTERRVSSDRSSPSWRA